MLTLFSRLARRFPPQAPQKGKGAGLPEGQLHGAVISVPGGFAAFRRAGGLHLGTGSVVD